MGHVGPGRPVVFAPSGRLYDIAGAPWWAVLGRLSAHGILPMMGCAASPGEAAHQATEDASGAFGIRVASL
jgi:hypothetical protein